MNRIKKNDEVIVIAGKDKGKRGRVMQIVVKARTSMKAKSKKKKAPGVYYMVEDTNMMKKHVRPNPEKGERGGIKEMEAPIHSSNVMLYNNATGKGDRVGFRIEEDGTKVRYFKSSGEVVDI